VTKSEYIYIHIYIFPKGQKLRPKAENKGGLLGEEQMGSWA